MSDSSRLCTCWDPIAYRRVSQRPRSPSLRSCPIVAAYMRYLRHTIKHSRVSQWSGSVLVRPFSTATACARVRYHRISSSISVVSIPSPKTMSESRCLHTSEILLRTIDHLSGLQSLSLATCAMITAHICIHWGPRLEVGKSTNQLRLLKTGKQRWEI